MIFVARVWYRLIREDDDIEYQYYISGVGFDHWRVVVWIFWWQSVRSNSSQPFTI